MKIYSILNQKRPEVISLAPGTSLESAAKVMNQYGVNAVMVQDVSGALCGILTERDLIQALADIGPAVLQLSVGDFMTRDVKSCRSLDEVEVALSLMRVYNLRHVPVIDQGQLVGMIGVGDVLKYQLEQQTVEAAHYLTCARARTAVSGYLS